VTRHQLPVSEPAAHEVLIEPAQGGQIITVTINRPAARNALSRRLASELISVFDALAADDQVRAVVLTGAGDRAFCAGADLRERRQMSAAERTAHTELIADLADRVAALPVPVIAAVRGYALAGGAELALACDLRVAATDAVFGFPEVRLGMFPGAGGVYRLPRLVGLGLARELLFTGRQVPAAEALRRGLVDQVVSPSDLSQVAAGLAQSIAANAPLAVRAVKRALAASSGLPEAEARQAVAPYRRSLDGTLDYAEGLAAFAEGRPPRFIGE
jgi:enoyl-CoA hydratase/carnithine racemase